MLLFKSKFIVLEILAFLILLWGTGCSDAEKQAQIEKLEAEKVELQKSIGETKAKMDDLGEQAKQETEKLKNLDFVK